jgi:hypothetical protein
MHVVNASRPGLLIVALMLGAATPTWAQTDEPSDDTLAPDAYDEALRPYGTWQDSPGYGRVWRPGVATGWQPYLDGRWVWTAAGWTWISTEPWSWTFHYGRWAFLPTAGWVWLPGSVWGPAWVRWVSSGTFVGWAPLPPFGGPAFDDYVFVRGRDFCAPRLRPYLVRSDRLPREVRSHWNDHLDRAPERHWIERESGRRVPVMRERPGHAPSWARDRPPAPAPERPLERGDAPPRSPARRWPDAWTPQPRAPRHVESDERPAMRRPRQQPPNPTRIERPPRPEHAERPWFPRPRGDGATPRPAPSGRDDVRLPAGGRPASPGLAGSPPHAGSGLGVGH